MCDSTGTMLTKAAALLFQLSRLDTVTSWDSGAQSLRRRICTSLRMTLMKADVACVCPCVVQVTAMKFMQLCL